MPTVHQIAFWHRYGEINDVNGTPVYTPFVFPEHEREAAGAKLEELQNATTERTYHIVTYFRP